MAESVVGDVPSSQNDEKSANMVMSIVNEIIYSPMNVALVVIIAFLVYKIVKDRFEVPSSLAHKPAEPELPKIRRDFTVQELRLYDGKQPDGRILLAVNGKVFDVTKGKRYYGPGGPYATLAGRDASRNFATFDVNPNDKEEYDDLSDLSAMELDSVREWEMQIKEKYDVVGKLLRKGEQPTNYEDEEDDTESDAAAAATTATSSGTATAKPNETSTADAVFAAVDEGVRKRDTASAPSTNEEVK